MGSAIAWLTGPRMKSFRTRLAVWSALISGAILVTFIVGDTFALYFDSIELIDAQVRQSGESLLYRAENGDEEGTDFSAPLKALLYDDEEHVYIFELRSPTDVLFRRSGDDLESSGYCGDELSSFSSTRIGDESMRLGTVTRNGWAVCLGANLDLVHEEVIESLATLLMILPGAVLVVALGGWWVGRLALTPIEAITRTAEEITVSGLDRRIPDPPSDDEIGRLVKVLNEMIGRLESSFNQSARFSADASHQLRTPLTVLQSEIDSAVKSNTFNEEQMGVLIRLMEEVQRLKAIVESLLILSRSDAGNLHLESGRLNLSETLKDLVEDTRILVQNANLEVVAEIKDGVFVPADESLLRQALLNLFDNAVRYNRPNGRVTCRLSESAENAVIKVLNTGAGIDVVHRDHIFNRFYKVTGAETTGAPGFGLGLSLASEIRKAHSGTLSRAEPDATEFEVTLPLR